MGFIKRSVFEVVGAVNSRFSLFRSGRKDSGLAAAVGLLSKAAVNRTLKQGSSKTVKQGHPRL